MISFLWIVLTAESVYLAGIQQVSNSPTDVIDQVNR